MQLLDLLRPWPKKWERTPADSSDTPTSAAIALYFGVIKRTSTEVLVSMIEFENRGPILRVWAVKGVPSINERLKTVAVEVREPRSSSFYKGRTQCWEYSSTLNTLFDKTG